MVAWLAVDTSLYLLARKYSSSSLTLQAVASPRGDHDWRHASRGQQAGGCCPAESSLPICFEDGLDDDSIGYLVDVRAIDQRGSWVPCELERPFATWRRDRRDRELQWWLTDSEIDGRPVDSVISSFRMNLYQELPLTFHMKCFKGSGIGIEKSPSFGCVQ